MIACTVGAAIICIDLLVQKLPGQQSFRIQDSNGFLAGSLSLSFGVMLFSSLNTMLPEAREYLQSSGLSDRLAAWINIICFLGGVVGIQAFSRVLHHFIPSNVVDCDHTHDGEGKDGEHEEVHGRKRSAMVSRRTSNENERTPLISQSQSTHEGRSQAQPRTGHRSSEQVPQAPHSIAISQRPNLQPRFTSRVATIIAGSKLTCDEGGPCYGYSDPCGMECSKIADRVPGRIFGRSISTASRQPSLLRAITTSQLKHDRSTSHDTTRPISEHAHESNSCHHGMIPESGIHCTSVSERGHMVLEEETRLSRNGYDNPKDLPDLERADSSMSTGSSTANEATHHHHVPENAFYSIGLQTSLAIALHKLPEGFITYATNHANPELGFSVFMALFIHNFTEGFAMALPMYLALKNRWRAMLISSVLGGISQPFGAGIAALWFHLAGSGDRGPGETVYGCMFSITAGIMASVALQLFSESLTLTHNRHICTIFAFLGMAILQISHALTA